MYTLRIDFFDEPSDKPTVTSIIPNVTTLTISHDWKWVEWSHRTPNETLGEMPGPSYTRRLDKNSYKMEIYLMNDAGKTVFKELLYNTPTPTKESIS